MKEKFLQYAWRPLAGFTFFVLVLNDYVIMPYMKISVAVPTEVWYTFMAILGVSAAGRSIEKTLNKPQQ
jgi:hypothetical protein